MAWVMLLFFHFGFTQCNKTAKKADCVRVQGYAFKEVRKDGSHICTIYVWHSSKWERNHLNMKLLSWRTGRRDTECTALHACVCVRWVLVSVIFCAFCFWHFIFSSDRWLSKHNARTAHTKQYQPTFTKKNAKKLEKSLFQEIGHLSSFCRLSYSICFVFSIAQ